MRSLWSQILRGQRRLLVTWTRLFSVTNGWQLMLLTKDNACGAWCPNTTTLLKWHIKLFIWILGLFGLMLQKTMLGNWVTWELAVCAVFLLSIPYIRALHCQSKLEGEKMQLHCAILFFVNGWKVMFWATDCKVIAWFWQVERGKEGGSAKTVLFRNICMFFWNLFLPNNMYVQFCSLKELHATHVRWFLCLKTHIVYVNIST